jgi:hypothetical protein
MAKSHRPLDLHRLLMPLFACKHIIHSAKTGFERLSLPAES